MAKRGRPRKIMFPVSSEPSGVEGRVIDCYAIPIEKTATLVWLGNEDGDLETVWNAVKFLRGVPTDVSDPVMIRKAKGNPYYEVVE